jgi:aminopeptidase N
MRKFFVAASLLLASACTPDSNQPVSDQVGAAQGRAEAGYLARTEAVARKRLIANPAYSLAIELDTSDRSYAGVVEIAFAYRGDGTALTVDFSGGEVLAVQLNGEAIDYTYNGHFISLPAGILQRGAQVLRVEYSQNYSQDGSGLYRYQDPLDGKVYLYTDFEPYAANRMFPHFDQPDLKGTFSLSVRAPAAWQVVSTTHESVIAEEGDHRLWTFPPTAAMSSYVFSLHAGDYVVFEDKDFRYPMRLFARQSMAQYLEPEEWFKVSRQGFDFFEEYFGLPYPFKKYDQLVVPDYNGGAMENIAAVTFSESYLSRGEATRRERMDLANVILHEMAHMWFGDIATMAWWNGLWLNESFATYMAELALANATEYQENWHEFFMGTKNWAYREDQLVTTHPIELPVPTTDDALTNFDGITYGKGASALKQLGALLGADVFRQGVQDYLAANAWDNTELEDFMGAMSQAANQDLEGWTQSWLYRAGLNSIEAHYSCEDGKISAMELRQTAPAEYPTLREQRTQIGLYGMRAGGFELQNTIQLVFAGASTPIEEASGLDCPDFVYPNDNDWAYIKVNLDDRSIAAARANMSALQDPMQRTMVWYDLYAMVVDAKLPLTDYLDIVAANLPAERDMNTASELLNNVRSGFAYLRQVPQGAELVRIYADKFDTVLWNLVQNSSGDARQTWLAGYIDTANNDAALERLASLLKPTEGFELDQDQRWSIILKLNEFRRPHHAELARAEAERDSSSIGRENAVLALVLAARDSEKGSWMERAVVKDENYSLRRSRTIQAGLFPSSSQRNMAAPYADLMLEQLPLLSSRHEVGFHDRVTSGLLPRLCTPENAQKLKDASIGYADLNPAIVRALKVSAQMDERCVKIVALLEPL